MTNHIYADFFRITSTLGNKYVCTSYNDEGFASESVVHRAFLSFYDLGLGEAFICKVDTGGCILLETIKKVSDWQ